MVTSFLPNCQSIAVQTRRKIRRFKCTFWGFRAIRVYLTFGLLFVLLSARIHDPLLVELPFPTYAVISPAQAEAGLKANVAAGVLPTDIQFPVTGNLTTRFSAFHPGIDILASTGTSIYPYGSGKVVATRFEDIGLGRSIVIDHGEGLLSEYGHLSVIMVKPGDNVGMDTVIGEVGSTGRSTGSHVHLEITDQGKRVDPLRYLPNE
ncbi:MAG: M23 family metallopeptidase [bacterium]|nr:M23 family metallopeptidase [bacterium]